MWLSRRVLFSLWALSGASLLLFLLVFLVKGRGPSSREWWIYWLLAGVGGVFLYLGAKAWRGGKIFEVSRIALLVLLVGSGMCIAVGIINLPERLFDVDIRRDTLKDVGIGLWILFPIVGYLLLRFFQTPVEEILYHLRAYLKNPTEETRELRIGGKYGELPLLCSLTPSSGRALLLRVEAKVGSYPFALFLLPQTFELSQHASAQRGTDIQVGDKSFDNAFFIEGAPATMVQRILTPEVRASVLQQRPELLTIQNGTFLIERSINKYTNIGQTLALLEGITKALPAQAQEEQKALQKQAEGDDPYRDNQQVLAKLIAEKTKELAEVEEKRALRLQREARLKNLVWGAVGLAVFGLLAWGVLLS